MPVHNTDIATCFNKLADLLEIEGANAFRVRAYRNAARTIAGLPQSVADMVAEGTDLSSLPGIGTGLAAKIAEIVDTENLQLLQEVENRTNPDLATLLHLPGLGPKRVQALYDALDITRLDELEEAARAGRIRPLSGFGERTEQTILEALSQQKGDAARLKRVLAEAPACALEVYLKGIEGVKELVVAGSYRRRQETIGDLDILVTCQKGSPVMERFVEYEDVERVVSQGKTRSTVVLHQGRCLGCGGWQKAQVPGEQVTGYGPRLSALMAELAGTYGNGRRMVPTFCSSVLGVPISLGAIQKVVDRVSQAIDPYYTLIATQARQAPVNYIDEPPWYCENSLEWLWVMASEQVAFYMIHPRRSKEALFDLIEDWAGLLVSDGYGVYQKWVNARQTCLAHLIRTARGLAARPHPELAAFGAWALVELQRWCQMAKAPPTGGEWRAWYARLCKLINRYDERSDDAGRFARRLLREMDSLWVFLVHQGVEPTNNRGERALRFGVQWRKRSLGTASDKGNRWVERILSLKETCRLRSVSTYQVLVDAVSSFFHGQQPDLAWLQ